METPAQREARCLIEKIHREHTLDGTILGTRFELLVSNCLEILSSQLYEKSTHFLLELIQNADDNTYDCPRPTLSFSYKPGSLRIDCNEVGFNAENVEAVCAISRSTKSGKTSDGEYIGEKGIGFKSVFKAADVVWISSRDFTFKFDKTKFLGMVAPIWESFPEKTQPECTSIYLQLSKDYEEDVLIHELMTFDTNLLIFLRRVGDINIRINRQNEQVWEKKIRKYESQKGTDRSVVLHAGEEISQYLIRTHIIKDLPKERKRPNWPQTKILLAFPTTKSQEKPQPTPQNVYAFLPIRNYGLKFLLQGDFLLTASREDIESTLPWNRTIRDALVEAFLLSIDHFNKGQLKYVWPYYLPSASMTTCSFLEPAIISILAKLRESDVLESCAETMVKASSLKHVPLDSFADGEGIPFTLSPHTAGGYLSLKYPVWTIEATSSIGVSQLSPREFLEDLHSAITREPLLFRTKSATWHSQLAQTLIKLSTNGELMSFIQDICLIPLHDGNWSSAKGKSLFFSKGETSLEIPSGIEVLIVDSTAETDPNRRRLYTSLGVKAWEAPEICRLILKVHESSDFAPKSLTVDQLIAHAAFIYKSLWQPPKTADIWFATVQDERCKGRKLYIPGSVEVNSPAARIFNQLQKQFAVIHIGYLKMYPLDSDWPLWLVNNLGLSKVPRLITPHVEPQRQPTQNLGVLDNGFMPNMSRENLDSPPVELQDFDFDSFLHKDSPPNQKPLLVNPSTADLALLITHPSYKSQIKGSSALQGYQTQLMLLEQQNRKRLLMARQESQDLTGHNPSPAQEAKLPQQQIKHSRPLQDYQTQSMLLQQQNRKRLLMARQESQDLTGHNLSPAQEAQLPQQQIAPRSQPTGFSQNVSPPKTRQVKAAGESNSEKIHEQITSSTPISDNESKFTLSEEFTFMFRECSSSDVLQLMKDNWHNYSQWIDGAHMNWQNTTFLESSTQLKNSLAACLVQSAKGSLPLQETVLPMIDQQLDEGSHIPAVDIIDPQHPEWTLLSYFGVIMKGNVQYYLRCLISISEEHRPDVDSVAYIYEQISARYKEDEELIRAAFYERDIIFIHSNSQGWMNMNECISRNISIESEYEDSSYLFRCLVSPIGDPIALLVATATWITCSTKLEDISRFFRDISSALKDVNTSKAAQLLRPLRDKSIFPITDGPVKRGYDKLLDVHNTSWYIADRPLIRESFLGQLPLLALPIEDLSALEDLFRILRLEGRLLSKVAMSRTQKRGRMTTHWAYTSSLRDKSPFIKALIPQSYPNRMTIVRQFEDVRVSVATDISQAFVLNIAGTEILGGNVRGQVYLSYTENFLNLLMTEECAAAKCPPYELATLIADACGITDPKHFSLLYTTLSNSSLESINASFKEQGIYIKGLVFGKSKDRYQAQRGDLMRIPSPFWGRLSSTAGSFRGSAEALWFGSSQKGGNIYDPDGDRRLPMVRLSEDTQSRSLVYENEEIDGWDHIQYLGEHMISKVLHTYLGLAYDPERDWTSELRSRSGHKLFEDSIPCAAFTMKNPKIREQMTAFIIEYGQSQTPNWKENLRANSPTYHLDVAVNAGSRTSSFVITTSQVERMKQFMMLDNAKESNSDIVVLVRVSDVYCEDLLSIDLYVDPWQLINSKNLIFEEGWVAKGTIREDTPGSTKKRRKLNALSVSWATSTISRIQENVLTTTRGRGSKETFTHRALDSGNIRLVYLLPGETGDQLQGVIIHVPYKSPGVYRALSYVWGTDRRTKKLVTPDGTLHITLSLHKALECFRHREKPIILWVDAICINQKDNSEKAKQIRLLPKIFQNAASTYAFLEGGKGSDAAMRMLMQVRFKAACDEKSNLERERSDEEAEEGLEIELAGDTDLGESTKSRKRTSSNRRIYSEDWPEGLPRVPTSWKHRSIPNLDESIWSSVGALFRLSWFRRVWIIQEIVGAPHVKIMCGKWLIDWNDLHLAIEIIDREFQMSETDSSYLKSSWEPFLVLAAQREWEARHYRWTLMMLLENFRYAESTLCRDRLFALLGLASDGNEAEFEPDYDSPLEDVILRFARGFVRQGRGIQMLYRAGLSHQSNRFPSWIPDWTVKRESSLHDCEGGVSFSASGPQQGRIKCIPNTDELLVDGYKVDEVESISNASNMKEEWEKYFSEVDTMIDCAILAPGRHLPEDLKWKVPIAGVLWPKIAVSDGLDLKSSYTALRNYLYSKQKGKAKENNNSVNGNPPTEYSMLIEKMAAGSYERQAASYIAALQDSLYGWRFVVTKNGYVGVVPNITKVGDVITILKGGRVPFVLKRSEERDSAFRLVGECYVHGLMNGEGLSLPGNEEGEIKLY